MESQWTLDELVTQATEALKRRGTTPSDVRVSAYPDRRTVRWYQTMGILDRPTYRGRVALYGQRHLLQVVAIKTLQARGRSLSQIQDVLTGAPDDLLQRVSGDLPEQQQQEQALPEEHAASPKTFRLGAGLLLVVDPQRDDAWTDPERLAELIARLRAAAAPEKS